MEWCCKRFDELTTKELYALLQARVAVFVVEQNCLYQDLDDVDFDSLHLFAADDTGHVTAYLRLFEKPGEPGVVQMGRVLTTVRGKGLGKALLQEGIAKAKTAFHAKELYLEAQTYAVGYYAGAGFAVTSAPFLEVGIEHVQMRLTL